MGACCTDFLRSSETLFTLALGVKMMPVLAATVSKIKSTSL